MTDEHEHTWVQSPPDRTWVRGGKIWWYEACTCGATRRVEETA